MLLKRNLYATLLLGLLLPPFALAVLKVDAKTISTISVIMIVLSVVNLHYLRRIESALHEESAPNRVN